MRFQPKKPEKDVITVRLPLETIRELEERAAAIDISRNELINQCIRFALDHLDDTAEDEDQ